MKRQTVEKGIAMETLCNTHQQVTDLLAETLAIFVIARRFLAVALEVAHAGLCSTRDG